MKKYDSLPTARPENIIVEEELERRLEDSTKAGALDWKAMCSPDKRTSAAEKRWVYNNVLRLDAEGKCDEFVIDDVS